MKDYIFTNVLGVVSTYVKGRIRISHKRESQRKTLDEQLSELRDRVTDLEIKAILSAHSTCQEPLHKMSGKR